jgi:thimet oligopeptidase
MVMACALAGFSASALAVQGDDDKAAMDKSAMAKGASPIAAQIAQADKAVAAIVAIPADKRTFADTFLAYDDFTVRLQTDTGMICFLANVSPDKDKRDAGNQAQEDLSNYMVSLLKRDDLYAVLKSVAQSKPKVKPEQQRLMDYVMRDFRRSGMDLAPEKREQLKQIEMQINKHSIEFEKNIAEDATRVFLTADELKGMPEEFMKRAAKFQSGTLYVLPVDPPTFNSVMDNCPVESTRQKMWFAWKRRGGQKNVEILENILKLRAEAANLLGAPTRAAYEIEVRMAKTPEAVNSFYEKLRPLVRPKAQADYNEYLAAKKADTKNAAAKLYPWDQPYYEKFLQREKYAVDAKKVQEYFPLQRVIDGLFSITQSLYGLEYKDITDKASSLGKPLWQDDVKLYEVWDTQSHQMLGEFYIDLYPRDNKYNHAACWGLVPRKVYADGTLQKPVAALVCNFTKPTEQAPSLLTHDEVETIFHEFGHCLHNILTEVEIGYFAGTSVESDFVEAPSQMFENWVWDADVLKTFARHYKTNEPLPEAMLQGMIKARYLGSGLFAEHQFYYGLTDLAYHSQPDGKIDTTKVALDLFPKIELYEPVPQSLYQASFGHLVNGGYVAGYYGYQWSLVYAQDMFQRFKELGMLDPKAGMYYRKKILARGGTIDAMDMLKDYLGREPKMDAYLEHLGLKK